MAVEEAATSALTALVILQEKIDKAAAESTLNISKSIKTLQEDVERLKSHDAEYTKGAHDVATIAQNIFDNYDKITSDDHLEITSGVIELISSVGAIVSGPYGPMVPRVCGLVASALLLIGGQKGPSMSEVIDRIIQDSLDDFKDVEIYGRVVGSLKEMSAHIMQLNGVANHNSGILSDEEKSVLTTLDFSSVGTETLGVLEGQIEKRNRIRNDKKKSKRLAKYILYYCMISIQKQAVLTLQCSLLRANEMEEIFAGVSNYLYKELPKEGRRVLDFLSDLPESKNWYMLYRHLHFSLQPAERSILTAYMKHIGCNPMEGQLCTIYNIKQGEYLYLSGVTMDRKLRFVFTWRPGCYRVQGLFRIVGDYSNCRIFSVYYSEYLYACVWPLESGKRRVFSWRPGQQVEEGDWEYSPDEGLFRNINENMLLYAEDDWTYAEEDWSCDQRRVFAWRKGAPSEEVHWEVQPVSFRNDDFNSFSCDHFES